MLKSKSKSEKVWIEPIVERHSKTIKYVIRSGNDKDEIKRARQGTRVGKKQAFRCLLSDSPIPYSYIQKAAQLRQMTYTLIAVVADGSPGRIYLEKSDEHENASKSARSSWKPEMPLDKSVTNVVSYGMEEIGDLFTARQLEVLNTLSECINKVRSEIEHDAKKVGLKDDNVPLSAGGRGAKAYSEAVCVYLQFALDRCADFSNKCARWNPSNEKVMNLFSRQAIPMTWDFGEVNILADVVGGFAPACSFISKCIEKIIPASAGSIKSHDAQTVEYPTNVAISTDPPYYDNIMYAELSDFFFAWQKRTLGDIYPNLFATVATPKCEQIVANKHLQGSSDDADKFFLEGMKKTIENFYSQANSDLPVTIYYAYKQSEADDSGISSKGWATFLQAVVDAGYSVVGTWPVRSEQAYRMVAAGKNALASSVVLVCRKRNTEGQDITRAEFRSLLQKELPSAIAKLQAANIAPADMPQSSIGPGMGVFSRYNAVLESSDDVMTVKTALQMINEELDAFLGNLVGDIDNETRFATTWFEQYGLESGEYGTAQLIAQAKGTTVEAVAHAKIVRSVAGKVRLLQQSEFPRDWSPIEDTHSTIWTNLHYLIRAMEDGDESAARFLKGISSEKEGPVKDLAYYMYDLAATKRGNASEATHYNSLIAIWTHLKGLQVSTVDVEAHQKKLI